MPNQQRLSTLLTRREKKKRVYRWLAKLTLCVAKLVFAHSFQKK